MYKFLLLPLLTFPLTGNAINKCEINGKVAYQNSPCPEGARNLPAGGGTFSSLNTEGLRQQAKIREAREMQERIVKAQEQKIEAQEREKQEKIAADEREKEAKIEEQERLERIEKDVKHIKAFMPNR
jgi:uncharacterized membrane protein